MRHIVTGWAKWIAAGVVAAWLLPSAALAGPAPKATTSTTATGEWQARLSAKVLEWTGTSDLDYGFSLAYWRDPNHPGSILGALEDGRGIAADPSAFGTFPSQSNLDLGLRIFLDQMYAKNGSLAMVLEALEQQGDVRMLAEPTLVLKKGTEATVKTGSRFPYSHEQVASVVLAEVTLFQETGVVLKVNFLDVVKLDDLYAKMKVVASVTSLAGDVLVTPKHRVPQANSRSITSTILIRNNTTLIAGILKEDSKSSNAQGPPILGDIWPIKYLFSNRGWTKTTHEILFLINVELIPLGAV